MAKKLPPEVQAIISASDAGLHATTIRLVQAYVADHPDSVKAWLDLGHSLGHLSRYEEAKAAFEKAIELTGDGPVDAIFGEIGHLFRAQGNFGEAASWYQKQIDADPKDATGYLFLGNLKRALGDTDSSIGTLTSALECEVGCMEEVHYALGLAYRNADQMGEAKNQFESALALDPKFAAAKVALKDVKRWT